MSSALAVSFLPSNQKRKLISKVVMQLLTPLSHLKGITSVAEVFRDAEDARKVVQEKVAGEMDNL